MTKSLDHVHHSAIQIQGIEQSAAWYASHFDCEVSYHDGNWALLKFHSVSMALGLPNQHPSYFSGTCGDAALFVTLMPHGEVISSVYIQDPSGNNVEMLKLAE